MTRKYKFERRPAKVSEALVRYVIEFEDGSTRAYTTAQSRYLALKELKEQGRAYLVKRLYRTGNVQGIGS
jgi:hypothetical protein